MKGIEQFLQVDAATLGALKYAGTWNASTNTPTLASGVGVQGQYYVVSVAGSTNLDGETAWQVGDWAVFNGSIWQKVDGGSTGLLTTLTVTGNTYLATTSGSVGVGTASPTGFGKFEVYQSANNRILFSGASAYGNNAIAGINDAGSEISMGIAGSPVAFYTNATERMRITSTGDVGIGTSSPAGFGNTGKLAVQTASSTNGIVATFANSGATGAAIQLFQNGVDLATIGMPANSGGITFAPSGTTERMRITSAGNVGIGTSSPNARLEANAAVTFTNVDTFGQFVVKAAAGDTGYLLNFGVDPTNTHSFIQSVNRGTNAAPLVLQRYGGDVGIGVTPSAWGGYKPLQVGTGASFGGYAGDVLSFVGSNTYNDNTNWRYIVSGNAAARYQQSAGVHAWFTAPSGTAGDAISFNQAMTLDASGNLLVGGTSGPYSAANRGYINISGSTDSVLGLSSGSTARGYLQGTATTVTLGATTGSAISFDINGEKARIDSSGNLGLGVTPSAWNSTSKAIQISTFVSVSQQADGAANFGFNFYESGANSFTYSTTDEACRFSALTTGGFGWFTAPSGTAGNAISFTQAMTLDASGSLLVGQTSSISGKLQISGAGGIRINEDGAGTKVVFLRSDYAGLGPAIQVSTADPLLFLTSNTERARIPAAGGMVVGTAAIATTATDGFLYVPTCAGTPTGTPTTQTGTAPIVIDTTNNKLYFYSGGQWRDAGP